MKKLKLTGKLNLNKETVSNLNDDQLGAIKGGITRVSANGYTCPSVGCQTNDTRCYQTLWNQDTCQGTCACPTV